MLTELFQNLRDFTIDSKGLETANSLIPGQSITELRECEKSCLVSSFQEALNFDTVLSFASTDKKNKCTKGYPCGKSCINAGKNCRNPIEGQAANYVKFLEQQAKKSGKMVDISDTSRYTGKNKPDKTKETGMKGTSEVSDLAAKRERSKAAEERVKDSLFAAKLKKGDLEGALDQAILAGEDAKKIAQEAKKELQDSQDKIDEMTAKALKNIDEKLAEGKTDKPVSSKNGFQEKEIKLAVAPGKPEQTVIAKVKGDVAIHRNAAGWIVSQASTGLQLHDFAGNSTGKKKAEALAEVLQNMKLPGKGSTKEQINDLKTKILSTELGISDDDSRKMIEENPGMDIWRLKIKHDIGKKSKT
jgi:hypothetical protein